MSSAKSRSSRDFSNTLAKQSPVVLVGCLLHLFIQSIHITKSRGDSKHPCLTPVYNGKLPVRLEPHTTLAWNSLIEHLDDGYDLVWYSVVSHDLPHCRWMKTVKCLGEVDEICIYCGVPFVTLFHNLS